MVNNSELPQTIVVNTIWDNINSNRRYRKMVPFLYDKDNLSLSLIPYGVEEGNGDMGTPVIMAHAADRMPAIREEQENFSLVQIMSSSTFQKFKARPTIDEYYYTVLVNSEDKIPSVENEIRKLLGNNVTYILKNKIQTIKDNDNIRYTKKVAMGSLAGLLTSIGLANVLSNALGLIYQRKREFSRYLTLGLSPKGVLKLLILEAAILAGKPILIGLIANIPIVLLSLKASFITLNEFLQRVQIMPIFLYAAFIITVVMMAYYIGGKRIYKMNLVEALKDDTLIG